MSRTAMALAAALLATPAAAQQPTVMDFSWLSGTRQMVSGDVTIEEHWTATADNAVFGVNRTRRGNRVVAFEFLRIQARGDTLFYIAQPNGSPPTPFRLTSWDGTQAIFENPSHDFPKRILYSKQSDGSVRARVDGGRGVEKGAQEFVFKRLP